MKRSNLFFLTLVLTLLTGLAHLRSDWLSRAPEPIHERSEVRTAAWSPRLSEPRVLWPFLRQR